MWLRFVVFRTVKSNTNHVKSDLFTSDLGHFPMWSYIPIMWQLCEHAHITVTLFLKAKYGVGQQWLLEDFANLIEKLKYASTNVLSFLLAFNLKSYTTLLLTQQSSQWIHGEVRYGWVKAKSIVFRVNIIAWLYATFPDLCLSFSK